MKRLLAVFLFVLLSGVAQAVVTAPEGVGLPASVLVCQPPMVASTATVSGTSEQTLFTCTLSPGLLDVQGRHLRISAMFAKAANTDTVTPRLYFGSEVISAGGVAGSGEFTVLQLQVVKTGASAQIVYGTGYSAGSGAAALVVPYNAPASETDTATITVKATCQDGTSNAGDCTLVDLFVEWFD